MTIDGRHLPRLEEQICRAIDLEQVRDLQRYRFLRYLATGNPDLEPGYSISIRPAIILMPVGPIGPIVFHLHGTRD